ncbi:uncharacterized protein LOC125192480 [Salvia hispanica]|uniref:uncharacterized protein LOC125192480 n=1 Tax=Salvia hispanica TaxID=49212 RepID=UPI0020090E76|nr:uncharacterized protein LOC125192480 [Salvia hispanica]
MSLLRMTLWLLVIFSCIIVQKCKGHETRGYGGDGPPVQCNKIECPAFTIIHSEKEFEIRNYSQALWVTAPSVVQYSIMGGIGIGEKILLDYFYRKNDRNEYIINAGPLLMMDVVNSTYKVYLYVPNKYQNGGLPKPLIQDVKQVKLPNYKYAAVRRIDGEITEEIVSTQVDLLKKHLKDTTYKRAADTDQFTYIMYDRRSWVKGYEILIWFN